MEIRMERMTRAEAVERVAAAGDWPPDPSPAQVAAVDKNS